MYEQKWEVQFQELKTYRQKFGHCDIPFTRSNQRYYALAHWCILQRYKKKRTPNYSPERISKLNSIGFCWSIRDKLFEQKIGELKLYIKKYGHCNVNKLENPSLGNWCDRLRLENRANAHQLTMERRKRLNELGFVWQPTIYASKWEQRFLQLKEYKNKHGHCDVPANKQHLILGRWCMTQRQLRKSNPSKYLPARLHKLNKLGFSWDAQDALFERRLQELKLYRQRHGHCNVSISGNKGLAHWCGSLRHAHRIKAKRLTPERISRLDEVGFVWEAEFKESQWEERFNQLRKFKNKYGHCDASNDKNPYYKTLASWCGTQRRAHNSNLFKHHPRRLQMLNELGFLWSEHEIWFDRKFRELEQYYKKHGHFNVKVSENRLLADWCRAIRKEYRNKANKILTSEGIKRLNRLGFAWNLPKSHKVVNI